MKGMSPRKEARAGKCRLPIMNSIRNINTSLDKGLDLVYNKITSDSALLFLKMTRD